MHGRGVASVALLLLLACAGGAAATRPLSRATAAALTAAGAGGGIGGIDGDAGSRHDKEEELNLRPLIGIVSQVQRGCVVRGGGVIGRWHHLHWLFSAASTLLHCVIAHPTGRPLRNCQPADG